MADSTLRRTPQLERLRQQASKALDRYSPETFRHNGVFTDDDGGEWPVRYSVKDPQQVSPKAVAAAEAAAREFEVPYRDVRVLTVDPRDTLPAVGASIRHHDASGGFEGLLVVLDWGQASDFTGISRGTCVLRR